MSTTLDERVIKDSPSKTLDRQLKTSTCWKKYFLSVNVWPHYRKTFYIVILPHDISYALNKVKKFKFWARVHLFVKFRHLNKESFSISILFENWPHANVLEHNSFSGRLNDSSHVPALHAQFILKIIIILLLEKLFSCCHHYVKGKIHQIEICPQIPWKIVVTLHCQYTYIYNWKYSKPRIASSKFIPDE